MEVITMQSEAFQAILEKLSEIEKRSADKSPDPVTVWLDNQEFCQLLKISKRTAQNYRDKGFIDFSQIGTKVYYNLASVHQLLEANKVSGFRVKK